MMKKLLSFLFVGLLLASCSKKDTPKPDTITGFQIIVKQNSKLQSGQFVANDVAAIIYVWKADGKDFDLTNTSDMLKGYAYDKISGTSLKYDFTGNAPIANRTPSGRYFVYVIVTASGYGQYSYSYSYFNVTDNNGDINEVKKVFTTNAYTGSFEDWNVTE